MKSCFLFAALAAAFLFAAAHARPPGTEPNPMNIDDDSARALDASRDPKELMRAAARLAASERPEDQQRLARALTSDAVLARLNAPQEYAGDPRRLRLRPVLEALARNPAPAADETLLELARSDDFTGEGGRVDLLILATASIRPAPPELVAFWDRHAQPEDGFTPLTIRALIENGSAPALALFEKKMADPAHEDDFKLDWMRSDVLTHRNSPELLRSCARLLKAGLPAHLRGNLVEALFDYRPEVWYVPAISYRPPSWDSYSSEARAELRALGRYALDTLDLTPVQRAAVERTLAAIGSE